MASERDDDWLLLPAEIAEAIEADLATPWKVLVVDDDDQVHASRVWSCAM